jgi:ABC-type multidrug transport system permease subunit
MEHRDVSDTADSTSAFRVAGAAISDTCHIIRIFFLSLVREKATAKNGYKFSTFLFLFLACVSAFIYLHRKEKLSFFYTLRKSVFSPV